MPSPFPGMDPYLENPRLWSNLHILLITATNAILKPLLRPRGYLVSLGERVWITQPGRPAYPDVAVIEHPRAKSKQTETAVIKADEPVKVRLFEVEVREPYVEIIDAQGGKLVTGIEFLSPVNKARGSGRELYLRKQTETLASGANLVEVDLLRRGRHTLAVPMNLLESLPEWDYLVSIARATHNDEFDVYPIPLRARLPRIRLPLKPGDEDAVLDLQAVMDRAYDEGPFVDRVDYTAKAYGQALETPCRILSWNKQLLASLRTTFAAEDSPSDPSSSSDVDLTCAALREKS